MIQAVNTIEDVSQFFKDLVSEGLNFHPDTTFEDYINEETKPTYTKEQADLRDSLMSQAFDICYKSDIDIYDLSMEIFLLETGMDKFIPLPGSIQE